MRRLHKRSASSSVSARVCCRSSRKPTSGSTDAQRTEPLLRDLDLLRLLLDLLRLLLNLLGLRWVLLGLRLLLSISTACSAPADNAAGTCARAAADRSADRRSRWAAHERAYGRAGSCTAQS